VRGICVDMRGTGVTERPCDEPAKDGEGDRDRRVRSHSGTGGNAWKIKLFLFHVCGWREERRSENKKREDGHMQSLALADGSTAFSLSQPRAVYMNITLQCSPLPHSTHTSLSLHPMSLSTPGDSPIWSLFQTVLGVSAPRRRPPLLFSPCPFPQSIVQVTLVCISGYVLARRGILDKSTQKVVTFISHHILPHRLTCSFIHSN